MRMTLQWRLPARREMSEIRKSETWHYQFAPEGSVHTLKEANAWCGLSPLDNSQDNARKDRCTNVQRLRYFSKWRLNQEAHYFGYIKEKCINHIAGYFSISWSCMEATIFTKPMSQNKSKTDTFEQHFSFFGIDAINNFVLPEIETEWKKLVPILQN